MLKSELIEAIYNLPQADRLFKRNAADDLSKTYNDKELRDTILKQYQYRNKDFEIVNYEDVSEDIKERVWHKLVSSRLIWGNRYSTTEVSEFVHKFADKLYDMSYDFCGDETCQCASKSSLNRHTKAELENFYNKHLEIYNDAEKAINLSIPNILENAFKLSTKYYKKCVIYIDKENIFEGVLRDLDDNCISYYEHGWYDKISDKTPEDYKKILKEREEVENSVWKFYQDGGIRD